MGQPRPLFIYFRLFKHTLQILQQKSPSSIRCWDLNSRPLEHESPSITTRPGLPPQIQLLKYNIMMWYVLLTLPIVCSRAMKISAFALFMIVKFELFHIR